MDLNFSCASHYGFNPRNGLNRYSSSRVFTEVWAVKEVRVALELATEEELQVLTELLFRPRLNPLDYLHMPDPITVQQQPRDLWLGDLEQRFCFLAADGITVLRRRTAELNYRQVLLQICRYLKVPVAHNLSTLDLEAEIFLHLLGRAWKQLPSGERGKLNRAVQRSLAQSPEGQSLPLNLQQDPMGVLLKGGSVLAFNSILKPWLLGTIAQQFARHFAVYQATRSTLARGGSMAIAELQRQAALQASRGMALSATRYGAMRTALSFLGPMLWTWFLADLGWRAIAVNYNRVIPAVFTLAQIRLTRSDCWEANCVVLA